MKTLFFGGPILTLEHPRYTEALLVEDGRIAAVGTLDSLQSQSHGAREFDLKGRALLPAFLDPHSHLSGAANGRLQCDLSEADSFAALTDRLIRFAQDHPLGQGQWLIGQGYDHNQLAEGCHPTRAVLDRAIPDHPVVIQHKSSHMGVFNSAALQQLGIGPDTPDPEGGRIERQDGAPTGYLEEAAFTLYLQNVPMPGQNDLLDAYQQAQQDYAAHGIATVQDGMMVEQLAPFYRALVDQGRLELDVVGYPGRNEWDTLAAAFPSAVKRYDGSFKLGGIKLFLDGSPQGRTAWMRTPYQGEDSGYAGYGTMTDQALREALEFAWAHRLQPLAHCNGDAAAAQYLAALDAAERAHPGFRALRPVMIHAQLLDLDQMADVARLGVIPSFFVAHVYHWGDVHIQNFGLKRAARISPARAALKQHIPFTFHQDTPVLPPDMLETLWVAATRRTKSGVSLGPDQRISVEDALRAVTCNAAYQYVEEDSKGSLKAGKRADLILLSADPLAVPIEELRSIQVLATWKDGRVVYWSA